MPNVEQIQIEEIIRNSSDLKVSNEKNINILVNNSRILLSNNKVDLALRLINQVLDVDSNNELALELAADIYIEKDKYDLAEKCYFKLLNIQESSSIYLKLANILYKQEKDELALDNYFKALEGVTYETHL
ncbi:hypothetical protein N9W41_00455, partial [bacterium]|nr:hypothetical protein [bacterium]